MIKYTKIYSLVLMFIIISFTMVNCREDDTLSLSEITLKGLETDSISVNTQTTKIFLLRGGNEKYAVNVANSKLAEVKISYDTLKVKGLFEGNTYATILSHDKQKKINIAVVPPVLTSSHDSIRLYPSYESKFISLSGGSEIVNLTVDDPEKALNVKWNANTQILEIKAFYEAEATITAHSENQPPKKIKVTVKSEGDDTDFGYYDTTHRYLYKGMSTVLAIKGKKGEIRMAQSANPYGAYTMYNNQKVIKISPIQNPNVGDRINVKIDLLPSPDGFGKLKEGNHSFMVEAIRSKSIVLRGKGYKFVVPK